ncbi:MAG: InlB B-repeat-containing protein [Clostridia bacterium]|nr:InlB B-repeat-containing protein [Clostridia bacterium]
MKKIVFLAVLLMALLLVSACGETAATTPAATTPGAVTTTAEATTTAPVTTVPHYTVSFYDEAGTLLAANDFVEGAVPSYAYNKADTAEWDYTVEGWSATIGGEALSALPAVSGNASYYAVVSAAKRSYTITFDTGDGSAVSSITREYGSMVDAPSDRPTLDGYRFVGWCVGSPTGEAVTWPLTLTGDVTLYASYNEQIDIKGMLSALLSGYQLNPYSYIPESMLPGFSGTLVDVEDIPSGYGTAVNISAIPTVGFGEQWNMILENLQESMLFFNALSAVETVSAASITAFNNYFDANPADTAHHTFASGIYNVTIDFDGETLCYLLEYSASFGSVGVQTAQIALTMDMETGEKTVRVQIGDANALLYTIGENSYTFAIRYFGVRRAFFSVSRDEDGNVSGHIYEYLTVSSVEVGSAADFYITEDYVMAVGNKADGLVGFQNSICELYDAETGAFLGYEVRESRTISIVSVTFNTLWFDLASFDGFTSIRYDAENNLFYVNGSSVAWEAKKVGGNILTNHKAESRRFDIELRTRYVYTYDESTETYVKHKIEVPMLFVQEENYETLVSDVKATNNVTISPEVNTVDLAMLQTAYDTLLDVFEENKALVTPDLIVALIGDRIVFD